MVSKAVTVLWWAETQSQNQWNYSRCASQVAPCFGHDPQITGVLFSLWLETFLCELVSFKRHAWGSQVFGRGPRISLKATDKLLQLQTGMFYYGDLSDSLGAAGCRPNTLDFSVRRAICLCMCRYIPTKIHVTTAFDYMWNTSSHTEIGFDPVTEGYIHFCTLASLHLCIQICLTIAHVLHRLGLTIFIS